MRLDRLVALEEAERVSLRVLAPREPADARDRLLVVRLAAELAYPCDVRVDVAGAEVDDEAAAARLAGVHGAAGLSLEHPVVDPRHAGVLELPAEERAVELCRAVGVLRRHLDVHDLSGHSASFRGSAGRSYTLPAPRPRGSQ